MHLIYFYKHVVQPLLHDFVFVIFLIFVIFARYFCIQLLGLSASSIEVIQKTCQIKSLDELKSILPGSKVFFFQNFFLIYRY